MNIFKTKRPQPSYNIIKGRESYCDEGDFKRSDEAFLLNFWGRSKFAKCNVQAIVIVAITEIIDVISLNGVLAIIHSSLPCSLTCPCEVSFQCRCACVQYTDAIRIISPRLAESLFEWGIELFERISLRLSSYVHLPELFVSDISTEYTLHHIGTVKAVHAVCAHNPNLAIRHLAGAIVDLLATIHSELQVSHEIVERVQLILNLVDKFRKVLPFHLATLVVEVEPDILN